MLRRKPKHNPVTPSLLAELIGWGYVTLTASLPPLDPPPPRPAALWETGSEPSGEEDGSAGKGSGGWWQGGACVGAFGFGAAAAPGTALGGVPAAYAGAGVPEYRPNAGWGGGR